VETGVRYNRPEKAPLGASRRRATAQERGGRGPARPAGLRASGASLRARTRPCRAERRPSRGGERARPFLPSPAPGEPQAKRGRTASGRCPPAHTAGVTHPGLNFFRRHVTLPWCDGPCQTRPQHPGSGRNALMSFMHIR